MKQLAFIFPGTGTQYPGMGAAYYSSYPEFRRVYEAAGDVFGVDIARLSLEGSAEEQSETALSHRLIYTMSMGIHAVANARLPLPCAYAGHSLGELAALTACGVFTLEQGLTALKWRSQYMAQAAQTLDGAMYAILGSTPAAVAAACVQAGGFVLPVNYNAPSQTVISGDSPAAAAAAALLRAQGAKAIQLGVTVPFHTARLQGAAARLQESLLTMAYNRAPAQTFFCNLTGSEMSDFTALPAYLAQQMVSPVLFTAELAAMQRAGITSFVEVGPGKVLTGLVKKAIKESTSFCTDTPAALDKAAEALNEL